MSWSSDLGPRVRVRRDLGATAADLATVRSPAARDLVVDRALVDSAMDDGYRAGYDAGFTAGLEDSASAIESRERDRAQQFAVVLDRLAAAADEIASEHAAVIATVEKDVVAIAFEIAQALLGRELRVIDDRGRDALRRALQFAPPVGPVVARLHPDDVTMLGNPESIVAGRSLTVTADTSLEPGDAIVDVSAARIDARIGPALARIREVLG